MRDLRLLLRWHGNRTHAGLTISDLVLQLTKQIAFTSGEKVLVAANVVHVQMRDRAVILCDPLL